MGKPLGQPVPGIRDFFSVGDSRATGTIETREHACCCTGCLERAASLDGRGAGSICTGDPQWVLPPCNVQLLGCSGQPLGQLVATFSWDAVEVNSWLAVVHDDPNLEDYQYLLLKVLELPLRVGVSTVCPYGNVFPRGSSVVKGHYLEFSTTPLPGRSHRYKLEARVALVHTTAVFATCDVTECRARRGRAATFTVAVAEHRRLQQLLEPNAAFMQPCTDDDEDD